jgi:hypothetical protein
MDSAAKLTDLTPLPDTWSPPKHLTDGQRPPGESSRSGEFFRLMQRGQRAKNQPDSKQAVRGKVLPEWKISLFCSPSTSTSGLLKITGPNLFAPYFSASTLIIKQFGRLFSA